MIWAGFGFMTLIAVLFAAWPLFARGNSVVATEDGTSAVLVDQLDEVQRDMERGVISEGEAGAARMEIKRRILALSRKTSDAGPQLAGDGNAAFTHYEPAAISKFSAADAVLNIEAFVNGEGQSVGLEETAIKIEAIACR